MVLAVDADHAADDGNAQFACAEFIGERLCCVCELLRLQIGYHIHAGFQLAVCERAVCRTVKAACIQAVLHLHLGLRLAVADDAACIRIRADGHIVGDVFQIGIRVAFRRDGDGIFVRGRRYAARNIAVVCRNARQKCIQRSARSVALRVGALIANQTAAVRLCGDGTQAVIDGQTVDCDILVQIYHVCADRTADIVPALHTARLDGQILLEQLGRSIQANQSADTVAGCGNTAADECVIDVNRAVCVIVANQTADKVPADNNACHTAGGDRIVLVREGDRTAVVAGQTARIAADGSPVGDALVNRVVGVRNVACAVCNRCVFLISTANAADIRIVARNHAGVDAVFDLGAAAVQADDTANVGVADDIAGVRGDVCFLFIIQQSFICIAARTANNTADVFTAKHIAVSLGRALVQHTAVAVTNNTANIFAAQLASLIRFCINIAACVACTTGAFTQCSIFRIADNTTDIVALQCTAIRILTTENHTLVCPCLQFR